MNFYIILLLTPIANINTILVREKLTNHPFNTVGKMDSSIAKVVRKGSCTVPVATETPIAVSH